MAEKVTIMRLKVNLQCEKCYKNVKQVLCKFPQIREQVFDEKKNIVTIKVVCCSPEKIRDQLCCKGCGAIKSIEIVPCGGGCGGTSGGGGCRPGGCGCGGPGAGGGNGGGTCGGGGPPPCCGPCSEGRTGGPCFEEYCRPPPCCVQIRTCCVPCSEGRPGGPCYPPAPKPTPPPLPAPVSIRTCCVPCSEGRPGGPCFGGYCRPPPCYEGYFLARPVYESYGGGRPCYVSRCDQYFNEENATGCTIM